jgi:subtilisin family serine protease
MKPDARNKWTPTLLACLVMACLFVRIEPCCGARREGDRIPGRRTDSHGAAVPGREGRFVPRELIVRFQDGLLPNAVKAILASRGIAVKKHRRAGQYHVLSLPADLPVLEAADWLQSQGTVDFAEPNYLLQTQETPDDTEFAEQWALANIDAEPGWDIETGRPEVVIAVIDTGVDYTHSDIEGNIWHNPGEIPGNGVDDDENGFVDDDIGWDFVEGTADCADDEDCDLSDRDPMDGQGHGTHVAGIAGAVTNNAAGIAGVAWHCRIMAVRAGYKELDGTGTLEVDDAAEAMRYAVDNGAQVLNLSWGDSGDYTPVREAVQYASASGVILCAAAGNDGEDNPFYPAAYSDPAVLAVGSTNSYNHKADTSNYGTWVDISAPGVGILSTCVGNVYCTKSGTSMAAPHVTGLTALLFSRFPGWSSPVIKDIIVESVQVVPGLYGLNATSGIVNLFHALEVDAANLSRFTELMAPFFGRTDCSGLLPCEGDSDGDGDVDGTDLAELANRL